MDVEHIDMTTTSQHAEEPGTAVAMAETVDEQMGERRKTIFTRVLIVALVMMFVSIGSLAFGLYLTRRPNSTILCAIVLGIGGMGFLLSLFPICIYTESKKTLYNKKMTSLFNCCRILSLIWFSFTLTVILAAVFFSALAIFLDDFLDIGMSMNYILLTIGIVMTILSLLVICPTCCCDKVYGYTRYQRRYGRYYTDVQPRRDFEDRRTGEERASMNYDNNTHNDIEPSAPPMDDQYHNDQRSLGHIDGYYTEQSHERERGRDPRGGHGREPRGGHGRGPGRGRGREPRGGRGRGPRRGHGRETRGGRGRGSRDGRPRGDPHRREQSRDSNIDTSSEYFRDRGRNRGHSYGRGGYNHEYNDRRVENELALDDEPPSYNEVMEQLENTSQL